MSAKLLAQLIIDDGDEIAYANRCTAAKVANKREGYRMFLTIAQKAAHRQDAIFTQAQIEECAALLQEHYSERIVQFEFFKKRRQMF